MAERHQVRVTLEYAGDEQAFTQALKAALKVLYRTFHLRCVGLVELPDNPKTVTHLTDSTKSGFEKETF